MILIMLYLWLTCFIATNQKKWSHVNNVEGSLKHEYSKILILQVVIVHF